MEHSKPKVTIDLDEYNQLIASKKISTILIAPEELAIATGLLVKYAINSSTGMLGNPNSRGFNIYDFNNLLLREKLNLECLISEDKFYFKLPDNK